MIYTYRNVRLEIKNGDIVLFNYESFLGKLINFFQKADYNHVGMFWWFGDRLFIVHANWLVHMMFASKLLTQSNFKIVRANASMLTSFNINKVWDRLYEAMNKQYDFLGLLRHAYFSLTKNYPKVSIKKEESSFVCSELVAWALQLDGWEKYQPKDFNSPLFKEKFNCLVLTKPN